MTDPGPYPTPDSPDRLPTPPADGTVLRPAGPPADGTVLRPSGPPADGTVLRPRGPAPYDSTPPVGATVLRPSGPPPAAPSDGTVLRPHGPRTETTADPEPAPDPWGATMLRPPPPGSWTPPAAPTIESMVSEASEQTVFAPHLEVPKAVFGSANAGESRFAPPEERPGVSDIAPPHERFAPLPIPGGPTDLPHGGRFAAPEQREEEQTRTARDRKVPGWLIALVGLLVVGLIGAGVWWRYFRPVSIDVTITVPTSSAPVNKPKVGKPEDAVLGYLTALRDGDIAKALSYGPVGPGSQVLLTPAAVKESQSRGRIDNIVVPPVTGAVSVIKARYTIGTEAVERSFNVLKTDDGGWQLAKSTTTVQLSAKRSPRVPLLINKQAVENVAVLELVPGVYHFETGLPFLRYAATMDLKVQSLDYNEPIQVLTLEMTDEGRAALLAQAQSSMQACLDLGSLNPPNCPFGYAMPKPVTKIKWTQKKDPWTGVQFTLTKEDPAVAEANFTISLNANVEFADGQISPNNNYEGEVRLTADITKQRQPDISVRWSEARR